MSRKLKFRRATPRYSLIAFRQRFGIDQQVLADRMGVTQGMISRIEAGERNPSLGLMIRWCEALPSMTLLVFDPRYENPPDEERARIASV